MSWIDDVAAELRALDVSVRSVRRFAFLVGGVAVVAGAWVVLRRHAPAAGAVLAGAGAVLALAGAAVPAALRPVYRGWMGLAFALGWISSRLVLAALFFLAVTPLAVLARLAGKRFLEPRPDPGAASYWTPRGPGRRPTYDKMY